MSTWTPFGHVDERAAGPHRRVERGELVVADRDDGREVLLEELRVLAERRVGVEEEDALLLEVLTDRVVDDLGLVLGRDAGDEALLLGLGDAELVVGVLDVLGQVVPVAACFSVERTKYLMLSKSMASRSAPQVGIGLRPNRRRPLRRRSSIHSGSFLSAEMLRTTSSFSPRSAVAAGVVGVGPAELVAADVLEAGVRLFDGVGDRVSRRGCHEGNLSAAGFGVSWGRLVRQVGGADAVAVGDGGETLDMGAEQAREHLGLGLAQVGELPGHVGDRAVVLADLLAGGGAVDRGGVAVGGERLGEDLGAVARARPRRSAGGPAPRRRPGADGRTPLTASSPPDYWRKRSASVARAS